MLYIKRKKKTNSNSCNIYIYIYSSGVRISVLGGKIKDKIESKINLNIIDRC